MTKRVEYTHKFEDGDSRIIDAVYYNEHTNLMFVRLKNQGIVVGYAEVPWVTYDSFKHYGSRGTYWNTWVKGHFAGVDGDVVLKPADSLIREQYEDQEWSVDREATTKPSLEREFTVSVQVEGTLVFNVNNEDALGAAQYVKNLLAKSVTDGVAFIKEVKVVE